MNTEANTKKRSGAAEKGRFTDRPGVRAVLSSLICIVVGLLAGFVVLLLLAVFSDYVPISDAFAGIMYILGGPFSSGTISDILFNLGDMILEATPLLMTGLSVAVAFKTGLFNIGAPGQYLIGAMLAMLVGLSVPTTPSTAFWVWLLALIVGIAGGVIWGAIPGFFKAIFNVNEVIVCIMTNWIAANVVSWVFAASGDRFINIAETKTKFLRPTATNGVATPKFGLDKLFPGSHIDIGFAIAVLIAVLMFIMLNKTVFGYELKACGFNKNAAKYAGMSERRNIMLSMMIAVGLAAGGAALWYLNGQNDMMWNTYSVLPANGFNGIPAALLAGSNPIGVIFSSLFLRYINKGGFNLAGYTAYNEYVSDLITAVIIYLAGFSRLIGDMLVSRRGKRAVGAVTPPSGTALDALDAAGKGDASGESGTEKGE